MDIDFKTILWAFLGGLIPSLIWLWFWLKEDNTHPEPKRLIFAAFLFGMLVVPFALVLEKAADEIIVGSATLLFIIWAAIEELLKYGAAFVVAFRKECLDRSRCLGDTVDPIIYMITAALGFAALENALFLIGPIADGEALVGFITGNLRFIGATVLHVVASSAIGVAMGLSFYKSAHIRRLYIGVGIFTAIVLHALFNLSIINSDGGNVLIIFGFFWVGAFILLLLFERVKKITRSE